MFQSHYLGQLDVDDMTEVIPRYVDLRRRGTPPGVFDHPVQHLGHARWVAHFFLVADHVLEQRHLLDFLETALLDGLVRSLRRHQQHRRVVPVGGLDGGDEVGDAGPVLRDGHAHLAGGAGVAVGAHAGVAFVGTVPELDTGCGEKVRDRHHGRADDAEGMLDAVHLQHLDEGFFRGHFHGLLQEKDL